MAKERSTLVVAINARGAVAGQKTYSGAVGKMVKSTGRAQISFGGLKTAAVALFAVLGSVRVIKRVVALVSEQEESIAQLRAGLESTNAVSGHTVESIRAVAEEMQRTTRFSNETVESIAAIGLSFTNITGDIFPRFLKVSADVSTRMGIDLRSTAVQLAKALNDPVANLGALSRAGIQFSKDQQETIKTLWESNRAMEAQNLVLQELERQYRGSATAARDTLGGGVDALTNNMDDLTKTVGQILSPTLETLIDNLNDVTVGLTEMIKQATALPELERFRDLVEAFTQPTGFRPPPRVAPTGGGAAPTTGPVEMTVAEVRRLTDLTWDHSQSILDVVEKMRLQRTIMNETNIEAAVMTLTTREQTRAQEDFRAELEKTNMDRETQNQMMELFADRSAFAIQQLGQEARLLAEHREELKKFREVKAIFDSIRSSVSSTFTEIVTGTQDAQEALKDLLNDITRMLVRLAIQKALSGIGPAQPQIALPGAADGLVAMANGQVVMGPTAALIGEKRPEVVMPLQRDERGSLGVAGTQGGGNVTNITLVGDTVSTIDMLTHDPKVLLNMSQNMKQGYAFD